MNEIRRLRADLALQRRAHAAELEMAEHRHMKELAELYLDLMKDGGKTRWSDC